MSLLANTRITDNTAVRYVIMKYRIITAPTKAVADWTSLRYVNDDVSRTDVT